KCLSRVNTGGSSISKTDPTKKPCFHPEAGLFYELPEKRSVFLVTVAFAAVADRAYTLFLVAAEAEFVLFRLVDTEGTRRAFMTLGAWVEPHMLGVVEGHISIVGLEDLGFGKRGYEGYQKQSVYEPFHNSNSEE